MRHSEHFNFFEKTKWANFYLTKRLPHKAFEFIGVDINSFGDLDNSLLTRTYQLIFEFNKQNVELNLPNMIENNDREHFQNASNEIIQILLKKKEKDVLKDLFSIANILHC